MAALLLLSIGAGAASLYEKSGFIVIEAENFATQHLDDKRRWFRVDQHTKASIQARQLQDSDDTHLNDASNGAYIELLPDTRTNHFEPIIRGENFTDKLGKMAVLSYPTYFATPGTYYVWVRAYSTGSEDNGVHIGINGQWPESSSRVQFCKNKHQWTWSSAQRTKQNHCGTPNTITITVNNAGVHNVMVSMREDGFELDKILLTQDKSYQPKGQGLPQTVAEVSALPSKQTLTKLVEYQRILPAAEYFTSSGEIPFYHHEKQSALAINAVNEDFRNTFVYAEYQVNDKDAQSTSLTLVTLAEIEGESEYHIYLNNNKIAQFTNPQTEVDYQETYFTAKNVTLRKGDIIKVGAKAVTNGKITENGGAAYARGRWRALILGAKVSH